MKNVALLILCVLLFVQCTGKKSGIVEDTIGYEFEVQETFRLKKFLSRIC